MKCNYTSVRVKNIIRISDKAFKIIGFDGSEDIFPASCILGIDNDVEKCFAYWIASWILPKKKLQYSGKKTAWFDNESKRKEDYTITKHTPTKMTCKYNNEITELKR